MSFLHYIYAFYFPSNQMTFLHYFYAFYFPSN